MNAAAIYLAATIVPGIEVANALVALGAGLVLGLGNAVARPVLLVLTLPFTMLKRQVQGLSSTTDSMPSRTADALNQLEQLVRGKERPKADEQSDPSSRADSQ